MKPYNILRGKKKPSKKQNYPFLASRYIKRTLTQTLLHGRVIVEVHGPSLLIRYTLLLIFFFKYSSICYWIYMYITYIVERERELSWKTRRIWTSEKNWINYFNKVIFELLVVFIISYIFNTTFAIPFVIYTITNCVNLKIAVYFMWRCKREYGKSDSTGHDMEQIHVDHKLCSK